MPTTDADEFVTDYAEQFEIHETDPDGWPIANGGHFEVTFGGDYADHRSADLADAKRAAEHMMADAATRTHGVDVTMTWTEHCRDGSHWFTLAATAI